VQQSATPGVFLATKADVTQTFFQCRAFWAGNCATKTIRPLEVASEILGGGFSSRLFRNVRTQHGLGLQHRLSDGAASYDHPRNVPDLGQHAVGAPRWYTLKAIREELDRIRTTEVTDQELQTAKDTTLNGFAFHFDRPSKTLNRLVQYEYYGYPPRFHLSVSEGYRCGHQGRRSASRPEVF